MENQELINAIKDLKESIDSLSTINKDAFNVDTSTDDMQNLCGKMHELIKSNEELKNQVLYLNQGIVALKDQLKLK